MIDECHRGSADEDSAWREILGYFGSAIQLGMTATPKETNYVSNIAYFGEPIYTYTLKEGILDGFLAPYKVVRIDIDKDVQAWTPPDGMKDDLGNEIEKREYNRIDMDRSLPRTAASTSCASPATAWKARPSWRTSSIRNPNTRLSPPRRSY